MKVISDLASIILCFTSTIITDIKEGNYLTVNPHSHMQHGWRCVCVSVKEKNGIGMCVLVHNRWTTKKHAAKGQYNQYPRYNKTQNAVMKGITLRKHHWKTYFPKLFGLVFISLPGLEPYQQPVDQTINSMAIGPGPQNVRHFWVEESSEINATKDRLGLICTQQRDE